MFFIHQRETAHCCAAKPFNLIAGKIKLKIILNPRTEREACIYYYQSLEHSATLRFFFLGSEFSIVLLTVEDGEWKIAVGSSMTHASLFGTVIHTMRVHLLLSDFRGTSRSKRHR